MEVNTEPSRPKLGHFMFKKCVMGGHCLLLCHVLQSVGQTRRQEKSVKKLGNLSLERLESLQATRCVHPRDAIEGL